jgi:diguanylate cyclase (GGDEF)-like protein
VTKSQTDKVSYPWDEPTREDRAASKILAATEQEGIIKAWIDAEPKESFQMFILLANRLSDQEKEALMASSDLMLREPDDLLRKLAALEEENTHLRSLSLTDGLTGLYNYRFFARQLDIEMARTMRTGQSCSLMMIDLDDFKQINDTFGHDAGNDFLVRVSETLAQRLRPTDIMCRYGGDEFAVIMPATDLLDAVRIAERLNASVSQMPSKQEKHFSVSIGVAEYQPDHSQEPDINQLVSLADKALYRAKRRGKDAICYEGQLPDLNRGVSVSSHEKSALLGSQSDE